MHRMRNANTHNIKMGNSKYKQYYRVKREVEEVEAMNESRIGT